MVFSDLFFIFAFIPSFALCYLLATLADKRWLKPVEREGVERPGFRLRNAVLTVFSLLFYAWGEPVYLFLMLLCVAINYVAGLGIARSANHRKAWLVAGVALDIALLGTFKYLGFFDSVLAQIGLDLGAPHLPLPIGISFYIFQSISYIVDVYRGDAPVQRRIYDLMLYIAMFPQLIAGPIVRYGTVAHEIHDRHVSDQDMADGIYRFMVGLGKKVILANILSEVSTQFLANSIHDLSMGGAWIGLIAFTLQIYFDFSGYSDMAIGLGRTMGFHFNENFNHPYCCTTITDFWRRWHMSLGSFFRDYAYIPMGGNRRHQALNILTVWFLTGMWHGASWNFIIWGLYFGLILAIEKYTIKRVEHRIPTLLLRVYALLIVVIGWGIFYFEEFDQMKLFFTSLVGAGRTDWGIVEEAALMDNFWIWIIAILLCMPLRHWLACANERYVAPLRGGRHVIAVERAIISIAILGISATLLVGATNNAFIYTRF